MSDVMIGRATLQRAAILRDRVVPLPAGGERIGELGLLIRESTVRDGIESARDRAS